MSPQPAASDLVEVRHLLSHTWGVSGLDHPTRLEDLYDARAAAAHMASHMPWWKPGTASGYHLLTYGHLIGERVHLLTGLPLRDFAQRHIAQPLGADFQIGLRDADAERVADVIAPTLDFDPEALDHDTAAYRTFTGPAFTASVANTAAWRADL